MAELAKEIQARKDALAVQYKNEQTDAAIAMQRALDDLKTDTENALKLWADMLQTQYALTDAEIKNIYQNLKNYFGPNGYVDALYNYLLAKMAAISAAVGGAFAGFAGGGIQPGGGHAGAYSWASGGSMFADKPTSVTFGEAGPEVAMFIPLRSPMGVMPSAFSNAQAGGNIQLEVLLSADLEARITQTSLNNVALAIDKLQRQA
jgi:hypothetical protein